MDMTSNSYQQKNEAEAVHLEATVKKSLSNQDQVISLSDSEDPAPVVNAEKASKKRAILGSANDDYRIKRRKLRVAGAPKLPLTGYVRYMNERREVLRKEFPTKTAMEHTKMIGEEWQQLPEERKAPYIKSAAEDKERYTTELNNFLKLNPEVLELERAKNKAHKRKQENKNILKEKSDLNGKTGGFNDSNKSKDNNFKSEQQHHQQAKQLSNTEQSHAKTMPGEIPIFTNEFLEHNKIFDAELRTLRKSKTDLEQQNAVLEKHVENMKFGVVKLTNENDELQKKNRLLEIFLTKLKTKLSRALAGLSIPSEPNGATMDNIDKYMADLYKMATSNTLGPASLNKAKDIIRKLDLEIHL